MNNMIAQIKDFFKPLKDFFAKKDQEVQPRMNQLVSLLEVAPMCDEKGKEWEHKEYTKSLSKDLQNHILIGRSTEKIFLDEVARKTDDMLEGFVKNVEEDGEKIRVLKVENEKLIVENKALKDQNISLEKDMRHSKDTYEKLSKTVESGKAKVVEQIDSLKKKCAFLENSDAEKERTIAALHAKLDQVTAELLALQITNEQMFKNAPHEASPVIGKAVSASKITATGLRSLNQAFTDMDNMNGAEKSVIVAEFQKTLDLSAKKNGPNQRISTLQSKLSEMSRESDSLQGNTVKSVSERIKELRVGTDMLRAAVTEKRSPTLADLLNKR